jgi:hypothetical protein
MSVQEDTLGLNRARQEFSLILRNYRPEIQLVKTPVNEEEKCLAN